MQSVAFFKGEGAKDFYLPRVTYILYILIRAWANHYSIGPAPVICRNETVPRAKWTFGHDLQ